MERLGLGYGYYGMYHPQARQDIGSFEVTSRAIILSSYVYNKDSMQISVYLLLNFAHHYLTLSRDESDQCTRMYCIQRRKAFQLRTRMNLFTLFTYCFKIFTQCMPMHVNL